MFKETIVVLFLFFFLSFLLDTCKVPMETTILAKHVGTISKTQHEMPRRPQAMLSCCCVCVQSEKFQWLIPLPTLLGERGGGGGGVPKLRNDSATKLMATGYRYPEYKCTLTTLFWYLSQKLLARIVHCFP